MRMRMVRGAALGLGVALAGVAGAGGQGNANEPPLTVTQWRLTDLYGSPVTQGRFTPAILFQQAAGGGGSRVAAYDGCNRIGGTYEAAAPALKIHITMSTRMACAQPPSENGNPANTPNNQPDLFQKALAVTERYTIEGGTLELLDHDGGAVARFGTADSDKGEVSLTGTDWKAAELYGKPVGWARSAPALTLQKGDKDNARLSAYDGCNRITGAYTLNGESLHIRLGASTLMACVAPPATADNSNGVQDVPEQFKKALGATESYRIANGKLELLAHDGSVVARFEVQRQ